MVLKLNRETSVSTKLYKISSISDEILFNYKESNKLKLTHAEMRREMFM